MQTRQRAAAVRIESGRVRQIPVVALKQKAIGFRGTSNWHTHCTHFSNEKEKKMSDAAPKCENPVKEPEAKMTDAMKNLVLSSVPTFNDFQNHFNFVSRMLTTSKGTEDEAESRCTNLVNPLLFRALSETMSTRASEVFVAVDGSVDLDDLSGMCDAAARKGYNVCSVTMLNDGSTLRFLKFTFPW